MKRTLLSLFTLLSLSAAGQARDLSEAAPFAVALGGQAIMATALFGICRLGDNGLRRTGHLSPLPFSVSVAGQPARIHFSATHAHIPEPVPADAEIVLGLDGQPAVLNLIRMDEGGDADTKAASELTIWKGISSGRLDRVCEGRKPSPGRYLLRITSCDQSATVRLTVAAECERPL